MSRKATDTKLRILQAAQTLFCSHGCENTTIDDILLAIGITKGAFYHYFRSKGALCQAVVDYAIEEYKQLALSTGSEAAGRQRLEIFIRRLFELNASGDWVCMRLILRMTVESHGLQTGIEQNISSFWQWQTEFLEGIVRDCRGENASIEKSDPRAKAQLLLVVLAGAITLPKTSLDGLDVGYLCSDLLRFVED